MLISTLFSFKQLEYFADVLLTGAINVGMKQHSTAAQQIYLFGRSLHASIRKLEFGSDRRSCCFRSFVGFRMKTKHYVRDIRA